METIRKRDIPRLVELFRELLESDGSTVLKTIAGLVCVEFSERRALYPEFALHPDPAPQFTGTVVRVYDGDCISVRSRGRCRVVRLWGIDAPEMGQPFGEQAKRCAESLVCGKVVTVIPLETDSYGRLVGVVVLPDGALLGHQLVWAGLAWWYRSFSKGDRVLSVLQAVARSRGVGLWSHARPTAPWVWRRNP